jgi:NAD(P)-dependent dehydrogenase (short-subunit alcohol dehydrogenase family)
VIGISVGLAFALISVIRGQTELLRPSAAFVELSFQCSQSRHGLNSDGVNESEPREAVLKQRNCLVIGGGSIAAGLSIGRAISTAYARAGARVAVADLNVASAAETVELIRSEGGAAESFRVDVLDDASIVALVQEVSARIGPIDVLHNNVGLSKGGDSRNVTAADWRRVQDANVTSLHIAAQAVLPGMMERRRGVILTTSSIAALRHLGYTSLAYAATKAAAIAFTRTLAIDYAPFGIRANTIVAGLMDTPRIGVYLRAAYPGTSLEEMKEKRHKVVPLGRMGSPWDIAEAAVFLASDRAKYITGTELIVDGGISATVPH